MLDLDFTKMMDDEDKMLDYHTRLMGEEAPLVFQQAVNCTLELFMEARKQIVAIMHTMRDVVVKVEEQQLREISYSGRIQRPKRKAKEDGERKRKRVREDKGNCFLLGSRAYRYGV